MNLITRIFVTLTAWTPLYVWVTAQPETHTLLMWPIINLFMTGLLITLGSAAAIMLLPPRQDPQVIA